MKKLNVNIEDIYIKGGPGQLTDLVKSIDRALQNIADNTDQMTGYLMRYSISNKGAQFDKAVKSTMSLRDELFDASLEFNEMQNQIVAFQNKVFEFEGITEMAAAPNPYLVTKRPVNVDSSATQINRAELLEILAIMRNYIENVVYQCRAIMDKKNEVAAIWRDRQYNDFSGFIDNIIREVGKSVKEMEEYTQVLEEKIKGLA